MSVITMQMHVYRQTNLNGQIYKSTCTQIKPVEQSSPVHPEAQTQVAGLMQVPPLKHP